MFDKFRLKEVLIQYKKDFLPKHWKDEKYKWEAVKCFQDNWDVKAEDFADMLSSERCSDYRNTCEIELIANNQQCFIDCSA